MGILYIQLEDLTLQFRVLATPVAELWLERMSQRHAWPLDHSDRFYGFNSTAQEKIRALSDVRRCVDTINQHSSIIDRALTTVDDQDTLNYLHNIFERYHGLLDQQHTEYWQQAPAAVRQALAELNLAVHRCETAQGSQQPRLVCTWYGQPKEHTLPVVMQQQYGTINPPWGSVCLNYCEIGKTLADLTRDRDNYIGDDAFRPFSSYSSDFVVRFFESDVQELDKSLADMQQYYNTHREFFVARGLDQFADSRLQPLKFPVAQLIETLPRAQLLKEIAARQTVSNIYIQ